MLDEFPPETSLGSEAKRPPPPLPALEDFYPESELAGSPTTVTLDRTASDAAGSVALLQALRSPARQSGPVRRSPAWPTAKEGIAGAALGIAMGAAVGFSVVDRHASPERRPLSSIAASQPVEGQPAGVSEDEVAATSLTVPRTLAASPESQSVRTRTPQPKPQTNPPVPRPTDAAVRGVQIAVGTSAVAVPTPPLLAGALAKPLPAMSLSGVAEPRRPESPLPPPSATPPVSVPREPAIASAPERGGVVAPSTIRSPDHQQAIDGILSDYRAAYDTRNARAVKGVWPAANEAALAKAFADLESQNLAFYGCRTSIEDSTARASCDGQVSYVARRGSRNSRTENRNWTFTLRRTSEDDWRIVEVQIR
jgi:hypothetical protein